MHLKQKNKAVSTSSHLKLIFLRKTNFFKNLYLKTPQTLIKDEPYRLSIAAISDTVEELSINTTLKESSLDLKTFCFFVPGLANTLPFKNNKCYKLKQNIWQIERNPDPKYSNQHRQNNNGGQWIHYRFTGY
jgi:hypothetical protein